jgi:hypothetical protein
MQTKTFWHDWQHRAQKLWSEKQGREITTMRRRAHHFMRGLDRQTLVALGADLGLLYPSLLDTPLLRVVLNPFYPWGSAEIGGVPTSVSDIALHRLVNATSPTATNGVGLPQIRGWVERGTVLVQSLLAGRERADAFHTFRTLRESVLLLTVHAWGDQLLDVVSHLGTSLLSPTGAIPPFLVARMAKDTWGASMVRLRCPTCRRVLTPNGLCWVHGPQSRYTVWR